MSEEHVLDPMFTEQMIEDSFEDDELSSETEAKVVSFQMEQAIA